jgi:FkbM family methyltransferase
MNIIKRALRAYRIVKKSQLAPIFEEVHLQRFFEHYTVDCVFDVGANEGQYATMLRQKVGYQNDIISFEPIPAAAGILRQKSRKDTRWYVEQIALDRLAGKATFNVMEGKKFSSLHTPSQEEVDLFQHTNRVAETITVETATVKHMVDKYKKLLDFKHPFLKLDTQGHDLEVAQGAADVLRSFVGLQSELSIKKIYNGTPDYKTVIDYYVSEGFELSAFVPNNEGHFPRLIEIDCIMYNKLIDV